MSRVVSFLLISAVIGLYACKESTESPDDFGYNYFPVEIGRFVSYQVDSIFHDDALDVHDTVRFYLKEQYESIFNDASGRETYRIERFKKDSLEHDWILKDIWFANVTTTTAERVEENVRYLRLAFPVRETTTWDGNSMNMESEWEHEYTSIDEPQSVLGVLFDSTLVVSQRDELNFAEREFGAELYARGIGLIEKELVLLEFQNLNPNSLPASGVEVHWQAIAYGIE